MIPTVLVAEPRENDRMELRAALQGSKYRILREVTNGDDAVAAARELKPSLIILCIICPGHRHDPADGGIKLIPRFLEAYPRTRVVVTHDRNTEYLMMAAVKAGALNRIRKPFVAQKVLEALGKAEAVEGGTAAVLQKSPRLKRSFVILYKASHEGFFRRKRSVLSENLSAGGMCVRSEERVPQETLLNVVIKIPNPRRSIRAQAKVIRSKPIVGLPLQELGLQFTQISPQDRKFLERYVLEAIVYKPEEQVQPAF